MIIPNRQIGSLRLGEVGAAFPSHASSEASPALAKKPCA